MLLLGASIFFVTCEGCASLFFKFSSSCFTWSKERFDHMVALVMLNSMKNQAIVKVVHQYSLSSPAVVSLG